MTKIPYPDFIKIGWIPHFASKLQYYNLAFILNNSVHLRLPKFTKIISYNNYYRELPQYWLEQTL